MSIEIRLQADDFFNAYRILSESNEAAINKLSKLAGKPLVSDKAFGSFPTMSPSVVCLAFAVELYIKDLYQALKIKPPRGPDGHNILKLYEGLPEQIKQEIFTHNSIKGNPFLTRGSVFSPKKFTDSYSAYDGFIDRVAEISDGFKKWRYSYESTALQYQEWVALALIEAVKSSADTIRPQSAA